jgi:hypothetical protein
MKRLLCSHITELILEKWLYYQNLSTDSMQCPSNSNATLQGSRKSIEKPMLKFIWKHKRPQIANATLSKRRNSGGITILGFNNYA